ncbi:MAG: hypothetical protein GY854_07545 [Deltaproteobacteria bacterium]|nr:hypothetical protein [Deltaproteobacteria bacterium]
MGKFDVKVYWSEWLPSEGSFLFEDESKGTTIEDDMVVTSSIFEETNGKASGIYNAVLASDDDFWINVCFTDVECAHTPGQGS